MSIAQQPGISKVTSVEGIDEYRLENGTQVLLFPDDSQSKVTVNMTVFVGSRHEGYGEAGMAHLLEHMLFKDTPNHQKIPELLKNRGADFNGTTSLDRTNYYETLPATSPEQAQENLEFAIRLEADRMMNSYVRGEDLASEMTVVRNEFEAGENNPFQVLMQRINSAAFDWHNYGRSTIGNRSDIERVPIDKLQAFYRKFYRPDNVMVVIAGKFDRENALELVTKYFGLLEAPEVPLDRTYTTEPAQDGERTVVLRRVGSTQLVAAAYHVPTGANREYAAVDMLARIFGTEPSGRMYQDMVVPELASNTMSMSQALHDPGLIYFGAQVDTSKSIESARQQMLQTIEQVADKPITAEELKRAQTQFTKARELRASNTQQIAIELSEWAAHGDWRLYFLFRDFVESLTPEECTAAAKQFLTRNNRTVGLFIPTDEPERATIPDRPDIKELLADYQGRGEMEQGEAFDPAPLAIEARVTRGALDCGLKTAWLPKKTRGSSVHVNINLRYGNEDSLRDFATAIEFLPTMLLRGTEELDYQQLQDRLDSLRARVVPSGPNGLLTLSIETKREFLPEVMRLVGDILRKPRFDAEELDVLVRQSITAMETNMTEPNALVGVAISRALTPYPEDDIRYVPTFEERIQRYRNLTIDQLKELYASQLSAQFGEVTAVGDFDPAELEEICEEIFADWKTSVAHKRIDYPAQTDVQGGINRIETPDKANALYLARQHIALRDDNPDYPALSIGNYILGAGALSSRLGDRVRQQEGLSYGVGSSASAHPIDERTTLTMFAITNPKNMDRVVQVIEQEVQTLLAKGITEEELMAAKQGVLQSSQLDRTSDANLAALLASTIFAERDMRYHANFENKVANLTVEDVNEALQKYIEPNRLVIFLGGDFKKAAAKK